LVLAAAAGPTSTLVEPKVVSADQMLGMAQRKPTARPHYLAWAEAAGVEGMTASLQWDAEAEVGRELS